jgi:putative nucleotidyltransferase with HDIG domain
MNASLTGQDASAWRFPCCPEPPDWRLDWPSLLQRLPWLQSLAACPQDPRYHAEGDVLTHTRMVCEALVALPTWRELQSQDRSLLFAAALLHDAGKPACTVVDEAGHMSAHGHARAGARFARRLLYMEEPFLTQPAPFALREAIVGLVRHHGLPPYLLDHDDPQRAVITASQVTRCDWLALLAEADVRGRICNDRDELLDRVAMWAAYAQEQRCPSAPYVFASDLARFVYFHKQHGHPEYLPYDASRCEVMLLAGLPGAGKDSYLQAHPAGLPVIALDVLRAELDAPARGAQGAVIATAQERARTYLRAGQGFVWNATNLTRQTRGRLIDLFVAYSARVRIVYLEVPFAILLQRNRTRRAPLPEAALARLARALEVPDGTEAHQVQIIA